MELQDKKYRILDIFFRLLKGEFVSSKELLVLIEILIASRALPKNSMEEIWLQCTKSFIHLWWNKRGWVTLGHTSIHFLSFPKHAYHPFYGINSFDFRECESFSVNLIFKYN